MQDANSIEEIYEIRDILSLCIFDLLEVALTIDDSFLERLNFNDATQILKCMNDAFCSYVVRWTPKKEVFENLPP